MVTPKHDITALAFSLLTKASPAEMQAVLQVAAAIHGHAIGDINDLGPQLAALAPKASPALTGTPTAPTANPGTNTQQLATTGFVAAAIAALVGSAPGLLNTLDELANALGDDANFAATVTTALAGKQASNVNLSALAGLVGAAGKLPYFTAAGAMALADIREATFTPTLTFTTPGDFAPANLATSGYYTKVGSLVTVHMDIQWDNNAFTTAAGGLVISGLPFAARTSPAQALSIGRAENVTETAYQLAAYVSDTTIALRNLNSNASSSGAGVTQFPASKTGLRLIIGGSYFAA